MSMLREKPGGAISTTRVGYFIKLAVAIATMIYCVYQKWLPMEMVILLGSLFGLNEIAKVAQKKMEK